MNKSVAVIAAFILIVSLQVQAAVRYVDLSSPNPSAPYSSGATAATNIQDAVDAASDGDTVVLAVGHYLLRAEVEVAENIIIRGTGDPSETIIDGQGLVRCFDLGNTECVISSMTITHGYDDSNGGGIYCTGFNPVVSNCTIYGNTSDSFGGGMRYGSVYNSMICSNTANYGGGLSYSLAYHCLISSNRAFSSAGGIYHGTAANCIISGNISGSSGGGCYYASANNCLIIGNASESSGGGVYRGAVTNCTISGNSSVPSGGESTGRWPITASSGIMMITSDTMCIHRPTTLAVPLI